jgi:hypothetical protein
MKIVSNNFALKFKGLYADVINGTNDALSLFLCSVTGLVARNVVTTHFFTTDKNATTAYGYNFCYFIFVEYREKSSTGQALLLQYLILQLLWFVAVRACGKI